MRLHSLADVASGQEIIDVGVAARQSPTDARPLQDGCYGPTSRHFGTHGLALSARPPAKTVTDLAHILRESPGDQRETTRPTTPLNLNTCARSTLCRPSLDLERAPNGGRAWWAHFAFTRINIAPTFLRKKIEDLHEAVGPRT